MEVIRARFPDIHEFHEEIEVQPALNSKYHMGNYIFFSQPYPAIDLLYVYRQSPRTIQKIVVLKMII